MDNCVVCGKAAVTERDNRPVCNEHRSMIDSGVFKLEDLLEDDSTEDRGDKAIIDDLRRQLTAVSAERDALEDLRRQLVAVTAYRDDLHHNLMREKMLTEELRVGLAAVTAERDAALDDANYWHSRCLSAEEGGE